jgi:hypothetical protein
VEFKAIKRRKATSPKGETANVELEGVGSETGEPSQSPASIAVQNLLVHIPGEASGFYLTGLSAIREGERIDPSKSIVLGVMALVILVVVRWVAGATKWVLITSVGAFVLWMAVSPDGFLVLNNIGWPNGLGLMAALCYSILVTVIGSSGRIK